MEPAIEELTRSLARVRDVADDQDLHVAQVLRDPSFARRLETIRASCTVLLSGYIESFLRDLARFAALEIEGRRVAFSDLPPKLKRAHYEEGGKILGLRARPIPKPHWVTAGPVDIADRLASAGGSASYLLVWEAFAETQANPRFGVITGFLKRLGVDKPNDRLDQRLPRGAGSTRLYVDTLIDLRNECAHTGSLETVPATTDLRTYCDVLSELAQAAVSVLEERFAQPPFGVDVNTATVVELGRLPGIGAKLAMEIKLYRDANGPFSSVSALLSVPGIGPALVAKLDAFACAM